MAKSTADEKILSNNDVVLRRSNIDILSGPHFLNDRIVEFYFSYLTSNYPFDNILLVLPSIAFWIKECPDVASLKDFVEPLHLSRRKLIILPINDNDDVSLAEGGSHWSLLAYERNSNKFVHHNSSAVVSYTASDATYVECSSTPKQVNGYDCGQYVTGIARAICDWYAIDGHKGTKNLWFSAIKDQITLSLVSQMRKDILEIVQTVLVRQ